MHAEVQRMQGAHTCSQLSTQHARTAHSLEDPGELAGPCAQYKEHEVLSMQHPWLQGTTA